MFRGLAVLGLACVLAGCAGPSNILVASPPPSAIVAGCVQQSATVFVLSGRIDTSLRDCVRAQFQDTPRSKVCAR